MKQKWSNKRKEVDVRIRQTDRNSTRLADDPLLCLFLHAWSVCMRNRKSERDGLCVCRRERRECEWADDSISYQLKWWHKWSHAAIVAAQPELRNYCDRSCTNNSPQGDPRNDNDEADSLQCYLLFAAFCSNNICMIKLFSPTGSCVCVAKLVAVELGLADGPASGPRNLDLGHAVRTFF